jgi:3-oxoacyl-(acyl-carrier-protein) synthase/DNA-binding FrmR family transcriptional regulator/copper chaperone CopZ
VRWKRGAMRMSPFFIPQLIANMASGHVAMRYGLTGPSNTVVTACATGSGSIIDAYRTIQRGEAELMFTGGAEACVNADGHRRLRVMKALSTRNDDPATASRPFTASRDGFVAGEGAGVLVLEERERALARGARIYAEVIGGATSADAHHITAPAPGGAGAVRCIRWALRDAGLEPQEVGYVNAHGTSTPANDLNETLAFKSVWGSREAVPPVSSTKSMTGHTLGAAGGIEGIATVQALASGVLPPTRNYLDPGSGARPRLHPERGARLCRRPRHQQVDVALSVNFAFGRGQNVAVVPMTRLDVQGMTCSHCSAAVQRALEAVPGVESATVDLDAVTRRRGSAPARRVPEGRRRRGLPAPHRVVSAERDDAADVRPPASTRRPRDRATTTACGSTRRSAKTRSRRLKSVRGHVEGVLRMLDDPNVYCVDVLKQVSAVQGALRKVSDGVLRSHIRDHVVTAAQRGDTEHIVDELMEALKYKA